LGVPTTPTDLHIALSGRYTIREEIGYGGMATVYLADDCKHDREVAVKVLRPELAATIGTQRFLREITITARLNHPNILPLLDSGEADGFLYYVMPYISGESLRTLLKRRRQVNLRIAVRTVREVAAALEHAHRHGVIHRDIKPENILMSDGVAVVADFGIARAVSMAGPDSLTRSGFPLGTIGYMSPEQAAGRLDLDPRTDVCSLTSVAYEMIVGETPGAWATPQEVLLGRFEEILLEHRALLDDLPGRVEQVFVKGLAIRRGDRFATPSVLAEAFAAASTGSPQLDDESVASLLARAAELDATHNTEVPALSMGGVEQIAAQVGIPPARVREAAESVVRPGANAIIGTGGLVRREPAGWPKILVVDCVLEGNLDPSAHEAIVEAIHGTLKTAGHGSALGHTLHWTCTPSSASDRDVRVTVTSLQNQTRIHIEEHLDLRGGRQFAPGMGAAAGALFGLLIATVLGGTDAAIGLMVVLMSGVGALTTVRSILTAQCNAREPDLRTLADRLVAVVETNQRKIN
jgi:hypothetical protein